jgi:phosphatidylinositol 4-kinase
LSQRANLIATGPKIDTAAVSLLDSNEGVDNRLFYLHEQIKLGKKFPLVDIRDELQRAAALLCSGGSNLPSISHYLVALPFEIFSTESISLGISLWLGAIHENPRVEPRILVEVIEAWETSILLKKGVFDPSFV